MLDLLTPALEASDFMKRGLDLCFQQDQSATLDKLRGDFECDLVDCVFKLHTDQKKEEHDPS